MRHILGAFLLVVGACKKPSDDDANPFATESGGVTKLSEAGQHLHEIGKAAKRLFAESGAFPSGKSKTLPVAPVDPVGGGCCGGEANKCAVSPDWASDPVWKALDFHIDSPSNFRYTYDGTDGKSFTATAVGDLDCDNVEARFTLTIKLDEHGKPVTSITRPAQNVY